MSEPDIEMKQRILSGDRELSQSQLFENVARAATGFAAMGVGPEDTGAIMLRNDFPFFEASMAANFVGAHAVPINWHFQADEVGYILRDSGARALVVHADLLPQAKAGIPPGAQVFVVPTPPEIQTAYGIAPEQCAVPKALREWDDWIGQQEPRELGAAPPPSSMIYTSGTTGNPNGQDDKRREIEQDGLVTVGDVGYLDEDDYLFLCDRKRDMVISGGVNIYPAEIETTLIAMPGVHDCAVFGIPDEEYGEALCAFVEPEPGVALTADGVREFLAASLARYKTPKVIEFRNDLPREDSGKIFKRKLRAPYWEKAGRQI